MRQRKGIQDAGRGRVSTVEFVHVTVVDGVEPGTVHLITGFTSDTAVLSSEQARFLAACLVEAAERAERGA